ncbi:hypothetical protein D9611_008999 [Ephemerocybe angulata]|uniref:Uncharacterized protein n=1 Tax=Ephemerocybe angulata TaxID=980116 RepID=A0A8H5C0H4_9AGAR|nr:hypothetical protein D9611_008999 [Tulosesus angulatus]
MMATLKRSPSTEPEAQQPEKYPRLSQPVARREEILENALAALTRALQRRDVELDAKDLEIASLRRQLVEKEVDIDTAMNDTKNPVTPTALNHRNGGSIPGAELELEMAEQKDQFQGLIHLVAKLSQKVDAISPSEGRQREDLSAASTQSSSTTTLNGGSSIEKHKIRTSGAIRLQIWDQF